MARRAGAGPDRPVRRARPAPASSVDTRRARRPPKPRPRCARCASAPRNSSASSRSSTRSPRRSTCSRSSTASSRTCPGSAACAIAGSCSACRDVGKPSCSGGPADGGPLEVRATRTARGGHARPDGARRGRPGERPNVVVLDGHPACRCGLAVSASASSACSRGTCRSPTRSSTRCEAAAGVLAIGAKNVELVGEIREQRHP